MLDALVLIVWNFWAPCNLEHSLALINFWFQD